MGPREMYSSTLLAMALLSCSSFIGGQRYVVTTPQTTVNQSLRFQGTGGDQKNLLILGSLFPLHNHSSSHKPDECGPLQGEDGILPLEALIFSVDQINNDPELLPGIQLGVLALDSCNCPEVALQQSLRFMKGFLASLSTHHESGFHCENGGSLIYEEGLYNNVVGVIGGQHSSVSVQMANVFRLFKIPQISYRSTSSSLNDRDRYPYFLRTVPSDNNQVEVIYNVLMNLNVSYVSLVYSDTEYGRGGAEELLKKARESNERREPSVCFADPQFDLTANDPEERFTKAVDGLLNMDKSNVVVLFADLSTALKVMQAMKKAKRRNPSGYRKLLWIGSDAWTSHSTLLNQFSEVIEGAIGIQPLAIPLPGFDQWFTRLTPDTNKQNPWFNEYWESHFDCSLNNDPDCSENSLKDEDTFVHAHWLHLVRDAAYAFAHALHNMWVKRCKGKPGLCEKMAHGDGHLHGEDLYESLKNVSFLDVADQPFQFRGTGEGTPRYTIFVFQEPQGKRSPWVAIANFTYQFSKPRFNFLTSEDRFPFVPVSECGKPCKDDEVIIKEHEDSCCWSCKSCGWNQYLNISNNYCESCSKCEKPENGMCVQKDVQYFRFDNQWAVTSMVFATLGILSTIFVGIIFWVHFHTPVIKAASRELSYILLGGILLSFCLTFAILMPPSPIWCGITRFFMGFSYTICYSAILTKTNRIHRVFNINPAKPQKAKYTSSVSQMMIVLIMVSVEVIIVVPWLVYYQPDVKTICVPGTDYNALICKGMDDFSYIVGFLYPFLLVCVCTVYAIKTRKSPYGFNEARYIAFSNYTTCVLWLIFIPLYLTTPAPNSVRLVALSMSLSLGAFVQLVCLFIPKVHIVLFKPEKNTRDSVMSQPRTSSQANVSGGHPGHSAPAALHVMNGRSSVNPTGHDNSSNSLPPNTFLRADGQIPSKGKNNPLYLDLPLQNRN